MHPFISNLSAAHSSSRRSFYFFLSPTPFLQDEIFYGIRTCTGYQDQYSLAFQRGNKLLLACEPSRLRSSSWPLRFCFLLASPERPQPRWTASPVFDVTRRPLRRRQQLLLQQQQNQKTRIVRLRNRRQKPRSLRKAQRHNSLAQRHLQVCLRRR